jgi:hypothetical protein
VSILRETVVVLNIDKNNQVDFTGHHFINGCSRDAYTPNSSKAGAHCHVTHNYMRNQLFSCCKNAFAFSQEEPFNMFADQDLGLKPDIKASFSIKGKFVEHALDLTIVSPFDGVRKGVLSVKNQSVQNPDHEANLAAKLKNDKYKQACDAHNLKFVPFVVYTSGKLHKDAKQFLENLASSAAERRHIPSKVLYNYYAKVLSVCLVKRLGYVISTKASGWLSHSFDVAQDYRVGNQRAMEIGDTSADQ